MLSFYSKAKAILKKVKVKILKTADKSIIEVSHVSTENSLINFQLYVTNEITTYRAKTFSSKEPETLRWIDTYGGRGVFYDIGANIGIYSIYYAKKFDNNVFAFEPSYFNLQALAKNINLNNLTDRIVIISNPVSDSSLVANFNLTSIEDGSAHSTFKEEWDQKGGSLKVNFKYKTLGLSLNHLFENNFIPIPTMIKIDVDGIEHLILNGAGKLLENDCLVSILVEVQSEFSQLKESIKAQLLKHHFKYDHVQSSIENQIWNRTP